MAVTEASVSAIGYFMPIFAFLLVFIVIYALLSKTGVLGDNQPVMLFISFILSSFFIVEASLVEFIQFSSAWFGVGVIIVFFLLAILAFLPGKEPLEFLTKGNWFAWAILGMMIAFFVVSSAYMFNWVINWGMLRDWFNTDWFGMILLLIVAGIVNALQGGMFGGTMIGFGVGVLVAKNLMVRYMCFEMYTYNKEENKKTIRKRELYAYHWHVLRTLIPFKLHLKE